MYCGSHAAPSSPRQPRNKKNTITLILSLLLVVALSVGGTVAFLTSHQTVTNTFTVAAGPAPEIVEKFDGRTKTDVCVKNKGDVDCLVRATVTVNLLDDEGNVIPGDPVYSITYNQTDWTLIDDIWYYNGVVTHGGGQTAALITTCTSSQHISVKIDAQTVQAEPAQAAQDLWGHSFNGSSWS